MFEFDTLNKKFEKIKEKFKLNENSINEIEKLKKMRMRIIKIQ